MNLSFLVLGFLSAGTIASANHSDLNRLDALRAETEDLYRVVYASTLRPHVKQSVYRFRSDLTGLCSEPGDSRCETYRAQTQRDWTQVENYLFDTAYDYPSVYSAYNDVRSALFNYLQGGAEPDPGPTPQPQPLSVSGTINHKEFWFRDETQDAIKVQCYSFCRSQGIAFVNDLTIAGQALYTQSTPYEFACDAIASHATSSGQ